MLEQRTNYFEIPF